jgi:hypothetical protein
MHARVVFPCTAIAGRESTKLALLLNAISTNRCCHRPCPRAARRLKDAGATPCPAEGRGATTRKERKTW